MCSRVHRCGLRVFTDGNELLSKCYVVAVKRPALCFETANQPIQVSREPQVRGIRGTLHRPDPTDEDFEIVHPAEQFLRFFQGRDTRSCARRRQLPHKLQRVPEFLDSDAHIMESIRQIQARRVIDRRGQPYRAARRTRFGRYNRFGTDGAVTIGMDLSCRRNRSPMQLVHIHMSDFVPHVRIQALALLPHQLPQFRNGSRRNFVSRTELVQRLQRYIELACGSEHTREAADFAHELAAGRTR
jgi:hypothetical protein